MNFVILDYDIRKQHFMEDLERQVSAKLVDKLTSGLKGTYEDDFHTKIRVTVSDHVDLAQRFAENYSDENHCCIKVVKKTNKEVIYEISCPNYSFLKNKIISDATKCAEYYLRNHEDPFSFFTDPEKKEFKLGKLVLLTCDINRQKFQTILTKK